MSLHNKDPFLQTDLFEAWNSNPEPEIGKPSGTTITEAKENQSRSYVWNSKNKDEWIEFGGETADIER